MKFNLKNLFTRREILENASLAGLGAALLPAVAASQQKEQPPNYQAGKEQPQSYQVGKDPGKHEPLANFKYDIESTTGWVGEAGSAREATVAEFPASQNIAGVSMRLKPGAIRELHWHAIAAEWALVLTGTVRSTVISPNGQGATDVFEPGDIWYFPKGHGHALQNISNEEAHFVLGFDDGHFSEFGTFQYHGLDSAHSRATGSAQSESALEHCEQSTEKGTLYFAGQDSAEPPGAQSCR